MILKLRKADIRTCQGQLHFSRDIPESLCLAQEKMPQVTG